MYQFILIIHVFVAVSLLALVLVQQGKGAATGAAFGSGASQTVFGSKGSGSFLLKVTIGFGAIFFATSIALNYLASKEVKLENAVNLPMSAQVNPASLPVSPSSIPMMAAESQETQQTK